MLFALVKESLGLLNPFFVICVIAKPFWTIHCPNVSSCPVNWGCRIHWLLLYRGVRHHPNECHGNDTKQSSRECRVSLHCHHSQVHSGPEIAPDRVLSIGQIELNCALMLNWIVWNRTVLTFNCVRHSITWKGLYTIKHPNQPMLVQSLNQVEQKALCLASQEGTDREHHKDEIPRKN